MPFSSATLNSAQSIPALAASCAASAAAHSAATNCAFSLCISTSRAALSETAFARSALMRSISTVLEEAPLGAAGILLSCLPRPCVPHEKMADQSKSMGGTGDRRGRARGLALTQFSPAATHERKQGRLDEQHSVSSPCARLGVVPIAADEKSEDRFPGGGVRTWVLAFVPAL
eukprot:CAMPEP_0115881540 /NCGR_PEP_ID=MMETSP0287-20121206/28492_1 /TAXON_ID=412157 /ORGANISM="Chrysochromulina rotalis, Strain UIO044" /LENGTH=172 /DNA_ID=CAMNT_0003337491 /DNA_START=480 /DNA_END=1000 /DNA_ORIENTATION=+